MFQHHNSVLGTGASTTMDPSQSQNMSYNSMHHQSTAQQQTQESKNLKNVKMKPYVKITEQPAGKALRFRYECEGRSAGSIPGVNSTPENKTYPTIEIVGYKGRAVVVVSCVTKDQPYRPHPHNLVGKEGCKKGVCTLEINSETMRAVFSNLGIQCVKKKDIESALKAREDIRVDPFKTGFAHRYQPSSIDLNSVRLCFQVFMESDQKGRFTQPLQPVVSDPIYDKKAMSDLVICRLCSCSASVLGNTQIILLCEKVAKEDIAVRFFEEENGKVIWEAYGDFQHTDVHKQTAISFKTPRYRDLEITEPAKVFIQLKRPSDNVTSEKLPFEYKPLDTDPAHLRRKRQKTNGDPMHLFLQHQNDHHDGRPSFSAWNTPNIPPIKAEPRDPSPQPFNQYRAQPELTPSPQPLSPSNNYNQHSTPSPYSVSAATPAGVCNPQLISPNHQNYINGPSNGAGGSQNPSMTPSPMDIQDYNTFNQQTNQQQQSQAHPSHAHQQQYQGNIFAANTAAGHWEQKFGAAFVNNNNHTQTANNMSNLNSTNPFTMHNLLSSNNHHQNASTGNSVPLHWNLPINQMSQQQHLQANNLPQGNTNQQQQQQYQHQVANEQNIPSNNENTNENGPTISNLLNFDSAQLVPINSEDLRLSSADLQISNLSIST